MSAPESKQRIEAQAAFMLTRLSDIEERLVLQNDDDDCG